MKPKLKAEKESTQNLWLAHIMCQKIIYFTNLYLYNYIYPYIIDYIFYQRGHSTFIQVVSKMSLYEALHLFPQKKKYKKEFSEKLELTGLKKIYIFTCWMEVFVHVNAVKNVKPGIVL